ASLEKAGVPPEELQRFKQVVSRLPIANDADSNAATPMVGTGPEALCKRLGRESIVMVSSTTAVGGTLRCVTLATRDHLALEKWTTFLEKAMSPAGQVAGASIFRACQTGDILRVKHLVSRGVGVNRANSYGCVALHYAVKHAAESAAVAARGGDGAAADQSKIRAQEALRVVVFLMSHGADARAVNHLGETPLELGSRLTAGFPKSRSLLLSILDSSKYQVTGGTIFIVPAPVDGKAQPAQQQLLESVREDGQGEDDELATAAVPRGRSADAIAGLIATTTARGVTFSPSRRNRRAKKRYELAKSRLPYVAAAAPSFGEGRCRSGSSRRPGNSSRTVATTLALPRGDHEAALGGPRHRLAAGHGARCSRDDFGSCGVGGVGAEVGIWRQTSGAGAVGVNFKNYRMGRSSGVFAHGGLKRRRRACASGRPASCPESTDGGDSCGLAQRARNNRGDGSGDPRSRAVVAAAAARNQRRRPATTVVDHRGRTRARSDGKKNKKGRPFAERRGQGVEDDDGARGPSIPDREARRQISEWLRESAGTASAVPPATAHGAGEHLIETSSYVAASRRSEVYKSLQAIKGDGQGELISAERLRSVLCRVGQPLLPNEMDELLRENDPTGTGYVSCTRLSKLVACGRLEPLAPGE
ncbi:unnamed protein product, partial [Hapterophycus canaliculatus]